MLQKTSMHLANQLVFNKIISENELEIYQYGFEILFSSLITAISICLSASIFDKLSVAILYLAITIPLRTTAGGYHATSYLRCFIFSNLYFLFILFVYQLVLQFTFFPLIWISILFFSYTFILLNAPIKNRNHPISDTTLKKNQKLLYIFLLIDSLIIIFCFTIKQSDIFIFFILTIMSVVILMFPNKIRRCY